MSSTQINAKDNGCAIADDCFQCPLPRCHLDLQGGLGKAVKQPNALARAAAIRDEDLSVAAAVKRFGVSKRTIMRDLAFSNRAIAVTSQWLTGDARGTA